MVRKNKAKIKPTNYWGLEHISDIIKRIKAKYERK